ncbi:hypothetical protein [Streptomyces sp. NPDC013181]|uniref:hypothetical protein n=1 Tax=Streptomyces sp. NPDC013181 TaxID=3364864 RepID=UPI00367528C0
MNTVTVLASVLKLSEEELLQLRRIAAGETGTASADMSGPGRPIGQWDPHELEVHPAGPGKSPTGTDGARALPGYARREHDQVLANTVTAAAAGRSGIVVLVGTSSTGKTRACWEAVQPLAEKGWRLWHPFDPTRAKAALEDLHRVGPRTVVWLNEAQHYLGDRKFGERIAAAVRQLLLDEERGPVLVLGTLWPEYAYDYTAPPTPGQDDPYSLVRELMAGHTVSVPDTFDTAALATATALAEQGDSLLADALTRNQNGGRITQDLAGAPELLRRYEQPRQAAARALLEAAMDARRLGTGLHIPQAFLTDAALDYLSDHDYDQLADDWAEKAYAELAEEVHGKQAPLRRTTPRPTRRPPAPTTDAGTTPPAPAGPVFRLADYLEQHGRAIRSHLCPPASFWHAAHTHLAHPDDLNNLAKAAKDRHRLQWSYHLFQRAADHGDPEALTELAGVRQRAGDWDGAETLYRQAADHGDTYALAYLAAMREEAGDRDSAETLYRQAADHGSVDVLTYLAAMREEAGDQDGAEILYRQAADYGVTYALGYLAAMRERAGDRDGAETLARQAADHGDTYALTHLAAMRERAGDQDGAETLARQAADHGHAYALTHLAAMREEAGDQDSAETLYRQAADHGSVKALTHLAAMREEAGDRDSAETLYRQAADHGSVKALTHLAMMREEAEDRDSAETLYRQAADHGNVEALTYLAMMREEAGDQDGAETLYRQAADHGNIYAVTPPPGEPSGILHELWPYGLDPDGTPTSPWEPSGSVELRERVPPRPS